MKRYLVLLVVFLVVGGAGFLFAQHMMGPGMGMMGGPWDYILPGDVKSLTIDEVAEVVERYLDAWGNPDLELEEIMEFSNHFYAEVEEESTGVHAFELLINKYTGDIFPEPGPNMMWNTKYGHMNGGMMGFGMMWGGWRGQSRRYEQQVEGGKMRITPEKAVRNAQRFLDSSLPGVKAASEVDTFYGYYTIHTLENGEIYGMLGVNGYSGRVWYHTWHAKFIRMKESGEHESL